MEEDKCWKTNKLEGVGECKGVGETKLGDVCSRVMGVN